MSAKKLIVPVFAAVGSFLPWPHPGYPALIFNEWKVGGDHVACVHEIMVWRGGNKREALSVAAYAGPGAMIEHGDRYRTASVLPMGWQTE
jgi:hypothetical protein